MKKIYLIFALSMLMAIGSFAQVGINTDNSAPNNSALLDVKSQSKGFLPPRMSHAELSAISNPADGLIVYCTDCGSNGLGTLSIFMDGAWYILNTNCLNPLSPVTGTHVPSSTQIVWNWNTVSGATGYKWNTTNDYGSATDMGTAVTKTETGLTCNTPYTRYAWAYSACGNSSPATLSQSTSLDPPSPTAGTNVPSLTQIVWNWNTVSGATGYKWNTTNDYPSATDMGISTTKTETGLTCNTAYTRYAWAYNTCGNSIPVSLLQTTSQNPQSTPTAGTSIPYPIYIRWNWNTVTGATGYKWNTTNDYSSAINTGIYATYFETGVTPCTAYTRYAWAYNNCGYSTSVSLSQTTSLLLPEAPIAGTNVPSPTLIIWNWHTVNYATGYKWNTTNDYPSAIDMDTTTTKTENGLTCNTAYTRYVWAYNPCGNSTPVTLHQTAILSAPDTGTYISSQTQIVWKWNSVLGANGYKWNTSNNYASAIDMGISTSKTDTGLTCNTAYTRYIWAYSTSCGVSTVKTVNYATSSCPCPGIDTIHYGGKIYHTLQIGSQCWLKENLDIGVRINSSQEQSNNYVIEKYCYNDLDSNCNIYGGLYQWNELMQYVTTPGAQGICPTGWHVPTEPEWCQMQNYLDKTVHCSNAPSTLGTDAGGKMKEGDTIHWASPNVGATNESGFTALPGGAFWDHSGNKYFSGLGTGTQFWSSSSGDSTSKEEIAFISFDAQVYIGYIYHTIGNSARCIKNN